jgi:holo-[acyl-carrier protein] synthase
LRTAIPIVAPEGLSVIETGVDIVEIERIEAALTRFGERMLERVYTPGEIVQCRGKAESLAARFAAKEAAFKVLGVRLGWREVEVQREPSGKPRLLLHGRALEVAGRLGLKSWSVSLSHSRQHAVAVVVALG